MNFLGTFTFNLDGKNRLAIPAKWKDSLSSSVVVSKGYDGCLELRSSVAFQAYCEDRLLKLNNNQKNSRVILRQLLGNAADLMIDKTSRILIPSNLLNEAGIKKEIYFVGLGNVIEIWDTARYDEYKKNADLLLEDASENL